MYNLLNCLLGDISSSENTDQVLERRMCIYIVEKRAVWSICHFSCYQYMICKLIVNYTSYFIIFYLRLTKKWISCRKSGTRLYSLQRQPRKVLQRMFLQYCMSISFNYVSIWNDMWVEDIVMQSLTVCCQERIHLVYSTKHSILYNSY